jgi:tetratricopeptide (TPR) repeat protein
VAPGPVQKTFGGSILIQRLLRLGLGAAIAASNVIAAAATPGIESTYAEHTRGVELARAGRYDDGLKVLLPLLDRFPNEYPLVRDVVLINTWKGDCEAALAYFDRIRTRPTLDDYFIGPVANCAVVLGRAGDYSTATQTLSSLLPRLTDAYPLRRDLAVITHWKGDCPGALKWFEPIRSDERNPPYLIAPMANCLRREERPIESLALLESGLARYPDDPTLRHERNLAEVALQLDDGRYDRRPELRASFVSADSDRDLREWIAAVEGSANLTKPLRVYARYLTSRTDMSAFDAGEMHRIGAGVRWRANVQLLFDVGVSGDTYQSHRDGFHARVDYQPYDPWRVAAGYDGYAEDISVRAAGIEATRSYVDLSYTGLREVWSWNGSVSHYDFSDSNRRNVFFTTLGYGYALLPEREHRIFVEWYRSNNSLTSAVYFNPSRDQSVALVHRTAFIFDSRFRRHVDTLSLSVGTYEQEGFGSHGTYGISYEQDYDFDDRRNLVVGVGYNRAYFDGAREDDWELSVQYRRRF